MFGLLRLPAAGSLAVCTVLLLPCVSLAHELVFFEKDVKPILQKSCGGMGCHIGEETNGVEMTTYDKIMASVGLQYEKPIVVPGKPEESPIIDKLTNATPKFGKQMPYELDPLPAADVDVIRDWIADGARKAHVSTRGDANKDDVLNITDSVVILNYLFLGGEAPACDLLADSDGDAAVNITDAVVVLNYLFLGGPAPAALSEAEQRTCDGEGELSFTSIYEKVFATSCAFSSCHSTERHKGGLALGSREEAYEALVGIAPVNEVALAADLLRVDPGKPENSFLLKKLGVPGPGEGNRMPANSSQPLSEATVSAIREWILAGAPLEGTIRGVPDISEESPPPPGRISQPPVPENGVQLHLPSFTIGSRAEREIFYFIDKPFAAYPDGVTVKRIDIHMSEESHHFILYQWIAASKPPAGIRESSFANFLTSQRFIASSQQSFFSQSFPDGVGLKFTKDASFDLNSHYINLSGTEPLTGEVYVNIFFADPAEVTTFTKPIFDINPLINVPPNQTRTVQWLFPGVTSTQADPTLGSNGRVTKETHIYALGSHMHRHGVRFQAFLTQNGVDVNPKQQLYDNVDWDDPVYKVFEPPLILKPGQGIRFTTTFTYDDPPNDNAPPLTFGPTSEDEMSILLGYYAVK